jgi:hypothetical protein
MKFKDIYHSTKYPENTITIISANEIKYKGSILKMKSSELELLTNSVNTVICIGFDSQFFI